MRVLLSVVGLKRTFLGVRCFEAKLASSAYVAIAGSYGF